ncbi:MAG: cob(I)yrinic acid a,c-diamide adenosyltransferase [Candidatus Pacearchaeota archaeon]
MIYLYTGTGAGKTTSALGLALRSLGQGHRVYIAQFMKYWKNTGEYKFKNKNYKIIQLGRKGWKGKKNLTLEDKEISRAGLEFVIKDAEEFKTDLLILDESVLAVAWNLLDEDYFINKIKNYQKKHPKTDIVLTGRYASKKLISIADYVNEIKALKMPKKMIAKKGINY